MFTGLVQDLGEIVAMDGSDDGVRLTVSSRLAKELGPGDSVAVSGVCLTATGTRGGTFFADVMNQTLAMTSLTEAVIGTHVNIELAMRPTDRLGGHIVQGHVDGVGRVIGIAEDGFSRRVTIAPPEGLLRYLVQKGSITVDGVSLTVAELDSESFTVSLIPETLERTTLGGVAAGAAVNLEVDVLAKYVERLINK